MYLRARRQTAAYRDYPKNCKADPKIAYLWILQCLGHYRYGKNPVAGCSSYYKYPLASYVHPTDG